MAKYICSECGDDAYSDGRAGDTPVLLCDCAKPVWVPDRLGGYYEPTTDAHPIPKGPLRVPPKGKESARGNG